MTTVELNAPALEFVDLGGYRMAYRQWGSVDLPKAIVLIHGITSSSLSWIRVAPRLAQQTRVLAVDLKGHGDSDQPPTGYRLENQADEVSGLIEALQLRSVRLMGHSWGGAVSTVLASRTTLPIECVVLEDPAIVVGGLPERRRETSQDFASSVGLDRAETDRRVRASVLSGWSEEDIQGKIDAAIKTSPASVRAVFDENGTWDVTDHLVRLRVPTLLVRAELELGGIVGESVLEAVRPNPLIQVVTIPGADHNIHRGEFEKFMTSVERVLIGPDLGI
jgi:pimeloyl-ACP methyl ester carboxylesterase